METLSDFIKQQNTKDAPGQYEFYEGTEPLYPEERIFFARNILSGDIIKFINTRNRVEVFQKFSQTDFSNNRYLKKISLFRFFERLKGIGVSYA